MSNRLIEISAQWHKATALCIRAQLGRPSSARMDKPEAYPTGHDERSGPFGAQRAWRRRIRVAEPAENAEGRGPSFARMDKPEAYPT